MDLSLGDRVPGTALTVIGNVANMGMGANHYRGLFLCDCGNTARIPSSEIPRRKSCGCHKPSYKDAEYLKVKIEEVRGKLDGLDIISDIYIKHMWGNTFSAMDLKCKKCGSVMTRPLFALIRSKSIICTSCSNWRGRKRVENVGKPSKTISIEDLKNKLDGVEIVSDFYSMKLYGQKRDVVDIKCKKCGITSPRMRLSLINPKRIICPKCGRRRTGYLGGACRDI